MSVPKTIREALKEHRHIVTRRLSINKNDSKIKFTRMPDDENDMIVMSRWRALYAVEIGEMLCDIIDKLTNGKIGDENGTSNGHKNNAC